MIEPVLILAVDVWGKEKQVFMCIEEMSELIKELSKNYRGKNNEDSIAEEIADVEIMLDQLKVIFDIEQSVLIAKEEKLIRLGNLINKELENETKRYDR